MTITAFQPTRSGRRSPLVPLAISPTPRRPVAGPPRGRVVILSATVGQGHEGAARELARRLASRGVEVEVHDYLDALPAVVRHSLRDLYQPMVQYGPRLFDRMFHGLEHDGLLRRTCDAVCAAAEDTVEGWCRDADVVVATYPLAGQTLGRLREQGRLTATPVTYLTDPAAHATWCHPSVPVHLTVTRATALDARRYGVAAAAAGPLCTPGFGHPRRSRAEVRADLGLPADGPVVLLSAGSLGMGAVPRTVSDVLAHPTAHVVVLYGRSDGLRRRLARRDRVTALGWRDDVPDLMGAADVLIHNAGGLSFTEALVSGLPAITYLPIPGHGRANAGVLDATGVAAWPRDPRGLPAAIDEAVAHGPARRAWPRGADPASMVQDLLPHDTPPGPSGAGQRLMIGTALAALVACAAAALLGGSSVAQRRAMPPASERGPGDPRLLAGLLRRGWWWAGTLASVAGLGLQLLALSFGSIIAVQTTMTSSIVCTTLLEWALLGRRPGRRAWLGIVLTGAGLLAILLALAPSSGPAGGAPSATVTVALAVACAVAMAAAVGYARRRAAPGRALGLAVATGLGYGVTAISLKTVSAELAASGLGLLAHPALWVALILGPLSVLLSQHALQAGRAVIAVVSVILVIDPLVGLVAGPLWFGEHIATTPTASAAAVAGGLALVAGIVTIQGGAGSFPVGHRGAVGGRGHVVPG